MNPNAAEKNRIRREMLERRAATEATWRSETSAKICTHALGLKEIANARNIAVYAAKQPEADTTMLVRELIRLKGSALLPRVTPTGLKFHRVTGFPNELLPGTFGILEPDPVKHSEISSPEEIELIFLPGAAFDRLGARIGYGKGHYDRFLTDTPAAQKYGFCFDFQLVPELPQDEHDVAVDGVITETGVHLRKEESP